MKITKFNSQWKFWEVTDSFALNWAPPEDARIVELPHDIMIETPQDPESRAGSNTGYRKGGVYSYSHSLEVHDPEKVYILKIEGASMNAFVYVNGQLAAKRPYGYSVFYVPLNRYLNPGGNNEIRIQVRAGAEPDSRWYPGVGLYRDVSLLEGDAQYIRPDSVQISTVRIPGEAGGKEAGSALIHVSALIANRSSEDTKSLAVTVFDASGNPAAKTVVPVENIPVSFETPTDLSFSRLLPDYEELGPSDLQYYAVETDVSIPRPYLWDIDEPNLYTCQLAIRGSGGAILDTHQETFGIRKLSVSPSSGFCVNGKEVKLRGACIHHDSGLLGAKTFEEVHIRQIQKLKEAGFNAIRSAHNPAAPALLRACDKVGMYVMDEAFDMWTRHKTDYDYAMYFEEWWEADVEAMVRNSFNHPSVIMYSVGNEIPEIGTPQGGRITNMICETIKSLDDTRFTLASVNGIFSVGDRMGQIVSDVAAELASEGKADGNVNDFMSFMHSYMNDMTCHPIVDETISVPFQYTDVAGYNYMGSRYDIDGDLHPERVIVGSETGIGDIAHDWERVKRYPYVIGDFCWTGWEYLGEAGIGSPNYEGSSNPFGNASFPLQISGTGCIDITGNRLPMSYYREIVFGLRKDPYIAVQDPAHYGQKLIRNPWIISDAVEGWSFHDYIGKPVVVEVYSDSDEVELFLNNTSLGRKAAGPANDYMAFFETVYEPGTLTAVSYRKGSDETPEPEETGRFSLQSRGETLCLSLTEEPLYLTDIPVFDHPEPEAAEESPLTGGSLFGNELFSGSGEKPVLTAQEMMEEYRASAQKAREMTNQLKDAYLSGTQGSFSLHAFSEQDFEDIPAPEEETPLFHIHFIDIAVTDENNITASDREELLHYSLEGEGEVLGFGSSDPRPLHNYTEDTTNTYRGRALLVIKKPVDAEPVCVRVWSDSELESTIQI